MENGNKRRFIRVPQEGIVQIMFPIGLVLLELELFRSRGTAFIELRLNFARNPIRYKLHHEINVYSIKLFLNFFFNRYISCVTRQLNQSFPMSKHKQRRY